MRRFLEDLGWRRRTSIALVLAWLAWAAISSIASERVPDVFSPYFMAPVGIAVGVFLGDVLARSSHRELAVSLLVGSCTILYVGVILTEGPAKGPTGYANANAAIAVQLMALCGLSMEGADRVNRRILWLTLGVGAAAIVANSSVAGMAVAVPLLLAVVVTVAARPTRVGWAAALASVAVAVVATSVVQLAGRATWPPVLLEGLDWARKSLWSDALALWSAHPITGSGPGSIPEFSALGNDPDTASAHSLILQVGAETGGVGVILLAGLMAAAWLWMSSGSPRQVLIGTAAVTALVIHSLVDHLLDFASVVIAVGIVVGWVGASGRARALWTPRIGSAPDRLQGGPTGPGRTAA